MNKKKLKIHEKLEPFSGKNLHKKGFLAFSWRFLSDK